MSIPHSINSESFERYGIHSIESYEGRQLIEQIERIDSDLKKLEELKELHVGTFESGHFKPPIETDDIRQFIYAFLNKRRRELVSQFNARFKKR